MAAPIPDEVRMRFACGHLRAVPTFGRASRIPRLQARAQQEACRACVPLPTRRPTPPRTPGLHDLQYRCPRCRGIHAGAFWGVRRDYICPRCHMELVTAAIDTVLDDMGSGAPSSAGADFTGPGWTDPSEGRGRAGSLYRPDDGEA